METKLSEPNVEVNQNFKLLKVKKDRYFVKFPNIDIPIEMNEVFYKQLLEQNNHNRNAME